VPALFLHFAQSRVRFLDAMRPSAYGIYLVHFVPLIWLQYLVYEPALSVFVKFAIVFLGTLLISWGATILLRRIPIVARMI
jgi:surface polysaccharide O-acyltransferase-like enzyme